ncbi:MAG: ArnT family glycosyltransferase [Bacteroidia bacterium]
MNRCISVGLKQWLFKYRYVLCFVTIGIVYLFNMFIDVMDIDAAQYAAMSREMLESGNYLQVHASGLDYLDKPPLLFWLASLSLKLFGVTNFAYKLPSVLFIILGIYSTYRFTLEWYDKQRATVAALVLCTTQAFFLMTNDVRMDGMLTSLVIVAIWQISIYLKKEKLLNLIIGFISIAAAMMAKGPIGIMLVVFAIGGDLVLKRKWKTLFKPQWVLGLVIVAVLLLPMCYGLYMQYDLHPEKEVYGLKGPSGILFFFWTQSFGRITGDIYWNNDAGYFFFYHSILWDFQPWIFFFIPALFIIIIKLIRAKLKADDNTEFITLFGFVLGFLALSQSAYKLPHYIFPLFPFAAIITANFIVNVSTNHKETFKQVSNIQFGILHLFFVATVICFLFFFPPSTVVLPIVIVLLFILYWLLFIKVKQPLDRLILPTIIACFAFELIMSTCFYPSLLKYQAEGQAGRDVFNQKVPVGMFRYYRAYSQSLDVYAQRIVPSSQSDSLGLYKKGTIIFTDQECWSNIQRNKNLHYRLLKRYDSFYVTALSIPFLYKDTRKSVLGQKFLIEKE